MKMQIIFGMLPVWPQMHPCLKGNVQETWTRGYSLLLLQVLPIYLHSLHVLYDMLTCTLHAYQSTSQHLARCNLFLDIQIVTLLFGKYSLFAHANL